MIILTKRYSVDRIEGNIAILVSDVGKEQLELSASEYGLSVNNVVDIHFEGTRITSVAVVDGESERRLNENRSRLHALFAKGKK